MSSEESFAPHPEFLPMFRQGDRMDYGSLKSCDFEQLSDESIGKNHHIVVSDGHFKYHFMRNGGEEVVMLSSHQLPEPPSYSDSMRDAAPFDPKPAESAAKRGEEVLLDIDGDVIDVSGDPSGKHGMLPDGSVHAAGDLAEYGLKEIGCHEIPGWKVYTDTGGTRDYVIEDAGNGRVRVLYSLDSGRKWPVREGWNALPEKYARLAPEGLLDMVPLEEADSGHPAAGIDLIAADGADGSEKGTEYGVSYELEEGRKYTVSELESVGVLPVDWKPSLGGSAVYDDGNGGRYIFEQSGDLSVGITMTLLKRLR